MTNSLMIRRQFEPNLLEIDRNAAMNIVQVLRVEPEIIKFLYQIEFFEDFKLGSIYLNWRIFVISNWVKNNKKGWEKMAKPKEKEE